MRLLPPEPQRAVIAVLERPSEPSSGLGIDAFGSVGYSREEGVKAKCRFNITTPQLMKVTIRLVSYPISISTVRPFPSCSLSKDAIGRAQLTGLLRLCDALDTEADALAAAYWLQVNNSGGLLALGEEDPKITAVFIDQNR